MKRQKLKNRRAIRFLFRRSHLLLFAVSGNDLLEPCPFFRNEIGGEGEREVGLTRCSNGNGIHRPPLSYGVSVLEPPLGETLWKHTCPLQKRPMPIESVDEGAHYYRRYFLGK